MGNLNAVKHGQRSRDRFNLVVGMGAKRDRKIIDRLRAFRNRLEKIVVEAHNEVSVLRAALINSATRWEKVAALGDRWLREEAESLDVNDRLNLVKSIAQASDSRDKCIKALGLDSKPADLWAGVYAAPLPEMPAKAPESDSDATVGDDGGAA